MAHSEGRQQPTTIRRTNHTLLIGYTGHKILLPVIIDGLHLLEYSTSTNLSFERDSLYFSQQEGLIKESLDNGFVA